jgi:hypothetical protein
VLILLILIFLLTVVVLGGVLWGGTLFAQGALYSEPAGELYWRGPAAGAAVTLLLVAWTVADCATGGHVQVPPWVTLSESKEYPDLKAVTKEGKQEKKEWYRYVRTAERGKREYRVGGRADGAPLPSRPEKVIIAELSPKEFKALLGDPKVAAPANLKADASLQEEWFRKYDADKDGYLSSDELKALWKAPEIQADKEAAKEDPEARFKQFDTDDDETFEPERDAKGNFKTELGQSLRYLDARGRVMQEDDFGRVSVYRWDWFAWTALFNVAHLAVWFVALWLLLRYQWTHALGGAVVLWLATSLIALPMLLGYAEQVFHVGAGR